MLTTKKKIIAMLLAGGQGSRLGVLTRYRAKPAIPYGGKYRIIDFPLSNCINSGIDTVGVLTQYEPLELNTYIGTGASWDLDSINGGAFVLPPYVKGSQPGEWYSGTANAIYQNNYFIDRYDPEYLLVLSGDHIYKMDYSEMIDFHIKKKSAATIAVLPVPLSEASRFGIINTDENLRIVEFDEKPAHPKSDLASMGIYIFNWEMVKQYLYDDAAQEDSEHDFGKNVLPAMLKGGVNMFAYPFNGYWKDVGTSDSLWEANMELLLPQPQINLADPGWMIYARNSNQPPHYVGEQAQITGSLISEGCSIYGKVENSVLSPGVIIAHGACVRDSIIMENTVIGPGSTVIRSIVDEKVHVGSHALCGSHGQLTVIGSGVTIEDDAMIPAGSQIEPQQNINTKGGV